MTDVYDMNTGEKVATYSLPPKEAIVACWEQSCGNHNTWEYAKRLEAKYYPLTKTWCGWTLGRFWVKDRS